MEHTKSTGVDKLLFAFIFFISFFLFIIEPEITSYKDALWYAFATVTTLGYGDFIAKKPDEQWVYLLRN